MKIRSAFLRSAVAVILLVSAGCGGGGGGSVSQATPQAVVTLSTRASAGTLSIYGVELYLVLPPGVSVKTDSSGQTLAGVLTASSGLVSVDTSLVGHYPVTDASGNTNCVKVAVMSLDPFGAGDLATVACDVAAGTSPKATDFNVSGFKAVDGVTGAEIPNLSAVYAVLMK